MRLICGVYRLDGADGDVALLRAMLAQMDVPRLKPTTAVWHQDPVALGLLDFGGEAALTRNDGVVMAADVRLDKPVLQGTAADAALLHARLVENGSQGLAELLGDFAFASWDGKTLTCGRDAFGIRPFFYVHKPGELFAFASLPKALHGSGIVPRRIDEEAALRRMTMTFRDDDSAVIGIKQLPPAHLMEVTAQGLKLTRYWQLDRKAVGRCRCSPEEAARELRRLVEQAVASRLPPGAIGAHLSGGLDSSALSVIAARRLRDEGRKLHAYSFLDRLRNDIKLEDETDFVRAVLDQEGDIDWTPVRPVLKTEPRVTLDLEKMVPVDPHEPENQVCSRAEEQGVHLILSGWGGDEAATFNGRGVFPEHFLTGRWHLLWREVVALSKERNWSLSKILYGEMTSYLLPEAVRGLARRIVGRRPPLRFDTILTAKARRLLGDGSHGGPKMVSSGCENRWRLMTSPHIAERAEVWAATGARHGLAFAFPLLDRRVVEFALSLPSAHFLRGGFRRRPFRDAMTDVLPERVRLRHQKYQPFPGWIIDMADHKAEYAARIDTYARNETVRELIDLAHLRRLVEAFPPPDKLRAEMAKGGGNPAATATMAEAMLAFRAAEYLLQHCGHSIEAQTAPEDAQSQSSFGV